MAKFNITSPILISIILTLFKFLKMFLGLIVLFLSIHYFGTSYERDAWVVATSAFGIIIVSLYSPINDTFRTRFIFLKEEKGEKFVLEAVNSLMTVFWISYAMISFLLFMFSDQMTKIIAPGFTPKASIFLSTLLLCLIPYFITQQMGNIMTALANTYESYFYPDFMALLASIINIISIIFLADKIGIYSLVIATTINGILLFGMLAILLKRLAPGYCSFGLCSPRKALLFLSFSMPVYLANISNQLFLLVEKAICSQFGEGSVSLFDYARQIMSLPNLVFYAVIPQILTPLLSKHFINGQKEEFDNEYRKFLQMLICFTGFISTIMFICGNDLSYIFFQNEIEDYANILKALSLALIFVILNMINAQALISQDRIKYYVISAIVGNAVSIALCHTITSDDKLYMIGCYYCIGQALTTILMSIFIQINVKKEYVTDLLKISLFIVLSGIASTLVQKAIMTNNDMFGHLANLISTAVVSAATLSALFFATYKDRRIAATNTIKKILKKS